MAQRRSPITAKKSETSQRRSPITLVSGTIYSRIGGLPIENALELEARFSRTVEGARFIASVRQGRWDGKVKFFQATSGRFLTGLLKDVFEVLNEILPSKTITIPLLKPELEIRKPFETIATIPRLRDYQEELIDEAISKRRGVVFASMNAGKTLIATEIIRRLGRPALYLVHIRELFLQIAARLLEIFPPNLVSGIAPETLLKASNLRPSDSAPIRVAMVQTLAMGGRLGSWKPDVLIADEVHRMTARTWQEILLTLESPFRFGLSGTPITGKEVRDLLLVGLTGPLFEREVRTQELIERGLSARPTITIVEYETPGLVLDFPKYETLYRNVVVENPKRHRMIRSLVRRYPTENVIILTNWVAHAKLLLHVIPEAILITGELPIAERKARLERFRAHKGKVLIATTLFDEGIDIPEIDVLILAGGGGKSLVKLWQRIGRGLRIRADKTTVQVYLPNDRGPVRPWGKGKVRPSVLVRHTAFARATFEDAGFDVIDEDLTDPSEPTDPSLLNKTIIE